MAALAPTDGEADSLHDAIGAATQKFHAAVAILQLEYQKLAKTHASAQDNVTHFPVSSLVSGNEQTELDSNVAQCAQQDSMEQVSVPERRSVSVSSAQQDSMEQLSVPEHRAVSVSSLVSFSSAKDILPYALRRFFNANASVDTSCLSHNLSTHINMRLSSANGNTNLVRHARDFMFAKGWLKRAPAIKKYSLLARIVNSTHFDSFCAAVIVLNSFLLFLSTDYSARNRTVENSDIPPFFMLADFACNGWFLIELILRMGAEGPLVFFSCFTRNFAWNMFDTAVVMSSLVETIVQLIGDGGGINLTALRMLRVLRLARALRIIRLVRIFKDLRLMVLSILDAFTTLIWALMLLMILIFMFGIFLTQNVTGYLYEGAADPNASERNASGINERTAATLRFHFGSMVRATYTLFGALTGGFSWQEVGDPLFQTGWINGLLFCFYIFFTVFSMLNIITGIFVESAITTAKSDDDEVITAHLYTEDSAIHSMLKIFAEADNDNSDSITVDEFDALLTDPRMRAHLESIGVDVGEAEGLFNLLDLDNSGAISIHEFLCGCMRMKGGAKAVDMQTLLYENKKMVEKWSLFTNYVGAEFEDVKRCQQQCLTAVHCWDHRVDQLRKYQLQANQPCSLHDAISQTDQPSWLRDASTSVAQAPGDRTGDSIVDRGLVEHVTTTTRL